MERYFIRAAKYFVYLVILLAVIYGVLILTGYSSVESVMNSNRRWLLAGMLVLLPLLYPFFGYVSREVKTNFETDRDLIVRIFESNGFVLAEENSERMVFEAKTMLMKLRMLYEDKIVVTPRDNFIIISGSRKDVVKTEFRINTFL